MIDVSAAMNDVIGKRKTIIEDFLFRFRLFDEGCTTGSEFLEFTFMGFEIGNDSAASV